MRSCFILIPFLLGACAETETDGVGPESFDQSGYDSTDDGDEKMDDSDEEKTESFDEDGSEADDSDEKTEESSEDDGESKEDEDAEEYGDAEKEEEATYSDCATDFDSSASCEGNWEDTLCLFDELIWWCEDGVWMNEGEK